MTSCLTITHCIIHEDPSNKLSTFLIDTLRRWRDKDYISQHTYSTLYISDGLLPRAYSLPKIHKENYPLRIIVSSLNSTFYNLATSLHNIISGSLPHNNTSIKDSFQLTKELKNVSVPNGYKLISLDVVSLFTNVPSDLAIILDKRWKYIKRNTKINKKKFLQTVRFTLDSTYFVYNQKIYKQTFDSPMDRLSPRLLQT